MRYRTAYNDFIMWLQYIQEQYRQVTLPVLKLSYEHPPSRRALMFIRQN